jgi:hypothetical protein
MANTPNLAPYAQDAFNFQQAAEVSDYSPYPQPSHTTSYSSFAVPDGQLPTNLPATPISDYNQNDDGTFTCNTCFKTFPKKGEFT